MKGGWRRIVWVVDSRGEERGVRALVSSVAGVADPGRGAERLSERFFSRGRMRKRGFGEVVLRGVAWGQS